MRIPAVALLITMVVTTVAQSRSARACDGAVYREFDFWIGHWNVLDAAGRVAGTSVIHATLDGCAITEAWTTSGTLGFSISFHDASAGTWRQTYVDSTGRSLSLSGRLFDGAMILSGTRRNADGRDVLQRLTWSRLPQGQVRQLWQSSSDAGQTWTIVFDARYVARA